MEQEHIPIYGRQNLCPLQYLPIFQIQTQVDLDMSSYSTNTVFRRVVTSGPCTVVSNEAYLAFNPVPSISVVTSADVDCNGNSSGSISIAAVNAILYSIDDGVTYQNSPNFSGLAAGNYDVVVENIGGCPASYALNPVVIDEPNALKRHKYEHQPILCNFCKRKYHCFSKWRNRTLPVLPQWKCLSAKYDI